MEWRKTKRDLYILSQILHSLSRELKLEGFSWCSFCALVPISTSRLGCTESRLRDNRGVECKLTTGLVVLWTMVFLPTLPAVYFSEFSSSCSVLFAQVLSLYQYEWQGGVLLRTGAAPCCLLICKWRCLFSISKVEFTGVKYAETTMQLLDEKKLVISTRQQWINLERSFFSR